MMNTSCEQKLEHCCDDNNPIGDSTNVDAVDSLSMCANCGKGEEESGKLKSCNACMEVQYCTKNCQVTHWPMHKKACKKRAAELHEEKLFKQPPPPEECALCFLILEDGSNTETFKSCCGKLICNGCIYAMKISEGKDLCPFCREPRPKAREVIEQVKKLMDNGNAYSFNVLANFYEDGDLGLPRNYQKSRELYLRGGELGCAGSYYNLAKFYRLGIGVRMDLKKAQHYAELAAMNGGKQARHNLGCMELSAGNIQRGYKHFIIAARAGSDMSLDNVKHGFKVGFVTKEEYESTLHAYHEHLNEMKSEMRDKAASYYIAGGFGKNW